MRARALILCGIAVAAAGLGGCVVSVDSIVPDSLAVNDARIVGAWREADGNTRIVVSPAEGKRYAVDYFDNDTSKAGKYELRVGRLGGRMVLDIQPADRDAPDDVPEAGALVRGHMLMDLVMFGDSARIAAMSPDDVRKALTAKVLALPYVDDKKRDQLVLLGRTAELRRALAAYVAKPGAFADPGTFRRVKAK